jgi:hypothetical protein
MQAILKACASREAPWGAGLAAPCPADSSLYTLYVRVTDTVEMRCTFHRLCKVKGVRVFAVEEYEGSKGRTPLILNLGTRRRPVVN